MSRTRSILPTPATGTSLYNGTTASRTYTRGASHVCTDEVAPGNGHNLLITHVSNSGGLVNGENTASGTSKTKYVNFSLQALTSASALLSWPTRSTLGLAADSYYASKILAMTNPSRPDVDIPVFLAELKDLPSLVYKEGGSLLRRIAKYNLRYQFAIRPLVSDLTSMLNWVQLVELRKKELEQLGKNGLRRRRILDRASYSQQFVQTLNSDRGILVLNHPITRSTKAEIAGFVRWFPTAGFPRTDAALLSTARRAVLGLTIDGATAWELIPFSWLIDWYSSVGIYLSATRNIVPCSHDNPQIMQHSSQEVTMKPVTFSTSYLTCSAYKLTAETKSRARATPSPITARLPFLTARQLSILASLVIVRAGKY